MSNRPHVTTATSVDTGQTVTEVEVDGPHDGSSYAYVEQSPMDSMIPEHSARVTLAADGVLMHALDETPDGDPVFDVRDDVARALAVALIKHYARLDGHAEQQISVAVQGASANAVITAPHMRVEHGHLLLTDGTGGILATFAPGVWQSATVETP